MFSEMMVQLCFRVWNSFFAPADGISLELRFRWMIVSFYANALQRICTPLLDKEFFERLICVNFVFFFSIFLSTTAAFGPSYYSYSTNLPFLQVILILSINLAACSGRY
jgi:succinate dehydrogenase/fumarate reductase cytochrome b subunit